MSFESLDKLRKEKKATRKKETKSGALSVDEKADIRRYIDMDMDPIEIAQKLDRTEATIRRCIEKELYDVEGSTKAELRERILQLRMKPDWKYIRQELTNDEVPMFEHEYAKVMLALQDDVSPIDEIHIVEFARCQVLKHRAMMEKKMGRDRIEKLRARVVEILEKDPKPSQDDLQEIDNAEREISQLTAAQTANSSEYKTHSDKSDTLFKMLKATRDQRIKSLDDNKRTTYIDVLKELAQEDKLERQGKLAALRIAATNKSRKKLTEPHTFADGEVCHPLLTAETYENG
jgi:hypothetical protein